jgi:hypothetical protein
MGKMGTLPNKMVHVMPGCITHLHGHWNKMVPFMKPYILANFNNGVKFHNAPIGRLMTFKGTSPRLNQ